MEQELFVMTIFQAMVVLKNRRNNSSTIGSKGNKQLNDSRSLSSISNIENSYNILNNQGDTLIDIEDDFEIHQIFDYQTFKIEGKCNFERVDQLYQKY